MARTATTPQRNGLDTQAVVTSAVTPLPVAVAEDGVPRHTLVTASPLDMPITVFKEGLDRRKANRLALMEWLRQSLVEGVDYGRVHIAGRDRCPLARQGRAHECRDDRHWSKPSLFKPGAEKITGMLGMSVHYPSLAAYEQAVINGQQPTHVILRCELRDAHGRSVAEGVGARSLAQDYGDINKALKMAEKSAHIDATLRLAGLSEVFTQDMEDGGGSVAAPADAEDEEDEDDDEDEPDEVPPELAAVTAKQVETLRMSLKRYQLPERRVVAWVKKATKGTVTRLEDLNVTQFALVLSKVPQWAASDSDQAEPQTTESNRRRRRVVDARPYPDDDDPADDEEA